MRVWQAIPLTVSRRQVLMRVFRSLLLGAALSAAPAILSAQAYGSRLLESGHWAYEYLGLLRSAGYLPTLDLLQQPLTRRAIATALAGVSPDTLPEPQASWVRLLQEEFPTPAAASEGVRGGVLVWGGVRAGNTDRLDPQRPLGNGGAWPRVEVGAWVASGPFVAESRVLGDTYLTHDPDGRHPELLFGGITDHTYASLTWKHGGAILGRFSRNWAPQGMRGLLLSDNPMGYPQLGVQFHAGRFNLEALTAELDTLGGTRRYLAANRVAYVAPRLVAALTEGLLYSASGSGLSLQLLDPFAPYIFESENPPDEARPSNLMLGASLWYGSKTWEVYLEGLLDDIDVHPDSGRPRAPTRYAMTVQAKWHLLGPWLQAAAAYERVSSYAYRSYHLSDTYEYFGRGLGENFSDYDRASLSLDVLGLVRGLRLTPSVSLLRQGEGDFRILLPPDSIFLGGPALFLGVVQRTYRLALQGRYQPIRQVWFRWDVGHDVLRNADHVTGRNASRFAALGEVGVRFDFGPGSP
jgi:hypothetical protein